jgi:nucleotide-binding universal stress UspA family protein
MERLEAAGAELEKTGVSVRTHLQKGYPPDLISRQAASCESDLIVMGTH